MGRHCQSRNATLPPNLYENGNGYYTYRHPQTGKKYGMGKRRAVAITAAKHLNAALVAQPMLAERVLGQTEQTTCADFLTWFETENLPHLGLAESTYKEYQQKLPHIKHALDTKAMDAITVADIAHFLDLFPATQSNHYRSTLMVIFKYAIARGLCESNPAEATIKRQQKKIQKRLTLDAFNAIYAHAPYWLQNAMDLGLKTLQRRGDLAALQWADIHDGYIWIQQQKVEKYGTGNLKIRITVDIQRILERCNDDIQSQYVIHRMPEKRYQAKGRSDFTAILPALISKEWSKARKKSEYYPSDSNPLILPGFHEIRSLGASLYKQAGLPTTTVQTLLGHTSEKMTEHYLKGHQTRWSEVEL